MNKLEKRNDGEYITHKKPFLPIGTFRDSTVEMVYEFAYNMTFGELGEHRHHRSGGTHHRRNGEIFANTFQGKLSEFAFYNIAHKDLPLEVPDLSTWELGIWDDTDFIVNGSFINIKSTKSFGNLLLLETKDWNNQAQYLPNMAKGKADYDYFILIRMNPYCEELLRSSRLLYNDTIDKDILKKIVLDKNWMYDIPGWCSQNEISQAINNSQVIKQGDMLNGKTRMDAENYYIQAGDMHPVSQLIDLIKSNR